MTPRATEVPISGTSSNILTIALSIGVVIAVILIAILVFVVIYRTGQNKRGVRYTDNHPLNVNNDGACGYVPPVPPLPPMDNRGSTFYDGYEYPLVPVEVPLPPAPPTDDPPRYEELANLPRNGKDNGAYTSLRRNQADMNKYEQSMSGSQSVANAPPNEASDSPPAEPLNHTYMTVSPQNTVSSLGHVVWILSAHCFTFRS